MTDAGPTDPDADNAEPDGRPGTPDAAPPGDSPAVDRTARFAWGAVAVILIGVIALVVYGLTRTSTPQGVALPPTTSSGVLSALSTVPASAFDTIGVSAPTTPLAAPTVLAGQPPLTSNGKPEVLFVGAEFCPFCASERWPLVVALSRFGKFTTLHNVQSAPLSVFAEIQSFTFTDSAYTSRYVTFTGVELYSDAVAADGVFARIATLTPAQSALVTRYGATGETGAYPFVDIGNHMVATTSGFSPAILVGQSQTAIVGALTQSDQPTGRAVVAAANELTAGICLATGQQPGAVCAGKGVRAADAALGIG